MVGKLSPKSTECVHCCWDATRRGYTAHMSQSDRPIEQGSTPSPSESQQEANAGIYQRELGTRMCDNPSGQPSDSGPIANQCEGRDGNEREPDGRDKNSDGPPSRRRACPAASEPAARDNSITAPLTHCAEADTLCRSVTADTTEVPLAPCVPARAPECSERRAAYDEGVTGEEIDASCTAVGASLLLTAVLGASQRTARHVNVTGRRGVSAGLVRLFILATTAATVRGWWGHDPGNSFYTGQRYSVAPATWEQPETGRTLKEFPKELPAGIRRSQQALLDALQFCEHANPSGVFGVWDAQFVFAEPPLHLMREVGPWGWGYETGAVRLVTAGELRAALRAEPFGGGGYRLQAWYTDEGDAEHGSPVLPAQHSNPGADDDFDDDFSDDEPGHNHECDFCGRTFYAAPGQASFHGGPLDCCGCYGECNDQAMIRGHASGNVSTAAECLIATEGVEGAQQRAETMQSEVATDWALRWPRVTRHSRTEPEIAARSISEKPMQFIPTPIEEIAKPKAEKGTEAALAYLNGGNVNELHTRNVGASKPAEHSPHWQHYLRCASHHISAIAIWTSTDNETENTMTRELPLDTIPRHRVILFRQK